MSKYYYVLWNTKDGIKHSQTSLLLSDDLDIVHPADVMKAPLDLREYVFSSEQIDIIVKKSKEEDDNAGVLDATYEVVEIEL